MFSSRQRFLISCLFMSLILGLTSGLGQNGKPQTKEVIEKKIASLQGKNEDSAINSYQEALKAINSRNQSQIQVDDFTARLGLIDATLKTLREDLAKPHPAAAKLPEKLDDAEKTLKILNSSLESASREIETLTKTENENQARSLALADEIKTIRDTISATPAPAVLDSAAPETLRARSEYEKARIEMLQTQLKKLELESEYLDRTPELLTAKKNLAARQLESFTKSRNAMVAHVAQLRTADASSSVQEAQASLEKVSQNTDGLKLLAEKNVELAIRKGGVDGISQFLSTATTALSKSEEDLRQVNEQIETAVSRTSILEKVGLSLDSETGYLLRQQRSDMPSVSALRSEIGEVLSSVTSANLTQLKLEEEQKAFLLHKGQILADALGENPSDGDKLSASKLLESRTELLEQLVADQRRYVKTLDSRLKVLQSLSTQVARHQQFVDERLLWSRSSSFYDLAAMKGDWDGLKNITIGEEGKKWAQAFFADIKTSTALWISFFLLWFIWRIFRRKINLYIERLNRTASSRICTKFYPTLVATVLTILLAASYSFVLWFVAWRCTKISPALPALYKGLMTVSFFVFLFAGIRRISKPDGYLHSHLALAKSRCALLRKHTTWFLYIYPLFIFPAVVLLAMDQLSDPGRGFFAMAMICKAYYFHRLFLPKKHLLTINPNYRWVEFPVYLIAIVVPLLLALGALLGFFHSVDLLREKVDASLWIVALAGLGGGFFLRWVLVSRRHAVINEAMNQRKLREEGDGTEPVKQERSVEEVKEDAARMVNLQQKTLQLARIIVVSISAVALWSVWSSTFPALNMLDKYELWNAAAPTETATSQADPITSSYNGISAQAETQQEPPRAQNPGRVSLQNLLFSIFALALTFIGARNIPAFLDLMVLRSYYTSRGGAFAITTSLRYFIIAIGVAYALAHIGIGWSNIQWIAAAITLGVGFGLQEIFANFVAGLIILFERPIRLGDYVTLGDVSGNVTKIQIRATTITDFSNKELVVPNKEFITGRLVNWTLSDPNFRVELPVGIAYGSDTKLAKDVLEQVARANEIVLQQPAPRAVFLAFGESTLNFELRVHIKGAENLITVRSQLNFAIDQAFREAHIEISYPQRDIHIRSVSPNTLPLPLVQTPPTNQS